MDRISRAIGHRRARICLQRSETARVATAGGVRWLEAPQVVCDVVEEAPVDPPNDFTDEERMISRTSRARPY